VINISFISQETTLFEGEAKMVVMDGQEGQLGIVKGHSPLLAVLKPGPVRMIQEEGEEVFFTNGGFAEVQPENITILVDSAVRADDLDESKILKAKEEAEKLLKDKKDQKDFAEVSSQLTQSLSQLRAIEALKKNVKLKK
jgi:F-type H+-transporting ATPase subunit epsilon|tara:strand:- start:77 stop:496 length:420 start_codon:yes stop_codon:yes gene_type:complete